MPLSTNIIETELAGSQTVLVKTAHEPLVGQLSTTLIVAGQEAFDAAAAAAPTGVLVAGLHGPGEFVGVTGAPHPDLDRLVSKGKTAIVLALGDAHEDAVIWGHAAALGKHLSLLGATSVRVLVTQPELATTLKARPVEKRRAHLAALVETAEPLAKRGPKAAPVAGKRTRIAPTVDFEEGVIYQQSPAGFQEVLVEASARRIETRRLFDDLRNPAGRNASYLHTLEVGITDAAGKLRVHTVEDVPDAQLGDARLWLNQVPAGVNVAVSADHGVHKLIEAALRSHESDLVVESTTLTRTGYARTRTGEWGYTSPSGLLLADGSLSQEIRSQLPAVASVVQMHDVSPDDIAAEKTAAANTLELMRELAPRPNAWYGSFGPAVFSLTGAGSGGANVVPWLYGLKGSGKTTVALGTCVHLSPLFPPGTDRVMAAMDASTSALSRVMEGLEHSFILVDDARKRTTARAADTQAESVEALVRTGYSGGSARRSVAQFDAVTKSWAPAIPELSAPVVMVASETLPAQEAASTLERIYPVPFDGINIFASGDSRRYEELGGSGLPVRHWAHLARWMLSCINEGGMDAWQAHVREVLQGCALELEALTVSKRVKNVASRVSCGMLIWLEYLAHVEVITAHEREAMAAHVHATVAENAAWHGSVNVDSNEGPAYATLLNALRAAVASGLAVVAGAVDDAPTILLTHGTLPTVALRPTVERRLGTLVTSRDGKGTQFLAMQPRDVLQILATEPRFRSLSEADLGAAFKAVSLTDGPGKLWKTVTVAGLRTKTLSIPYDIFTGVNERADEAAG